MKNASEAGVWVYIKDGAEIDRRICSDVSEADHHEYWSRQYRGLKWCDSWCTLKNAVLIGYKILDIS